MRHVTLYNPASLVRSLFGGPEKPSFSAQSLAGSADSARENEAAASEEASRRARAAAAAQTGRRTTLLTGGEIAQSQISSTRKTLLGSN